VSILNKTKHPLSRIFADSRKQWPLFAVLIAMFILAGLFISLNANLWGAIVDHGTKGESDKMLRAAVLMLIVVLVDNVRVLILNPLVAVTTERMFISFRLRAFSAILRTKTSVLESKMRTSDTAVRINSNAENLCEMMAGQFTWLIRVTLQGVVAAVSCIFLSWQLSFAYFFILIVSIWVIKKISTPVQKQTKLASERTGKAMNIALDMLNGLSVIKSFQVEAEMADKFATSVDEAVAQNIQSQKISVRMALVKYLGSICQLMTMFVIGTLLVAQGMITVGQVMAFVALSGTIREAFGLSDNMMRTYRSASALAERLYEVIDLETEAEGEDFAVDSDSTIQTDYMTMQNLTFRYNEDIPVLKGIDMQLKQNRKIGIIGPSGSGKSSIIKLICKFYDHQEGLFSILGHPVKAWAPDSLRSHLAIVTQEPFLFSGSIYENLKMGNESATDEQMIQALRDVQLWDFVCSLENAIHTDIGEDGARLSGGQKQRLSIARAILKNAEIILLDEPTSALDTVTEAEIQKALENLLENKAAVIMSHRLSALNKADYIYCIKDGMVIEEGMPNDLMQKKGYFYEIKLQQIAEEGVA
jgi:ABC-type multidrug transport system fused ATPase/permease subunit